MFGQSGSITFPMTYDYNFDGFYSSKRSGWKGLSSLEKSLTVALALVSLLAIALMVAVIVVGIKLNKDDYSPPEKLAMPTEYPPWITTIPTTTTFQEVTTRERPTTLYPRTTPIITTTPEYEDTTAAIESEGYENMLWSIDKTANPCENFYQFACGGWLMHNPPNDIRVDQFLLTQAAFEQEVQGILKSDDITSMPEAMELAREFYSICINESNDSEAGTILCQHIDDIFAEFDNETGDFIPLLSRLVVDFEGDYIFPLRIDVHLEDETRNAIYLGRPDFSELQEVYLTDDEDNPRRDAYEEFIAELWLYIYPEDSGDIETLVNDLIEFEKNLFLASNASVVNLGEGAGNVVIVSADNEDENYTQAVRYVNTTLTLLLESLPHAENWPNYPVFSESGRTWDLILTDFGYYASAFTLINETDANITLNYLKWRTIFDFAKHYSESWRNLYNQKILNLNSATPREAMCVETTLDLFTQPVLSIYIQEKVTDPMELQLQVEQLTSALRRALFAYIDEAEWISEDSTREYILKRLETLEMSSFPLDSLMENSTMMFNYSTISLDETSHLQSLLEMRKWHSGNELQLIWMDLDETKLYREIEAQTSAEVSYSYVRNTLYLPTAIMRLPLYNAIHPNGAFNYGSIGSLIGRQLVEALQGTAVEYSEGTFTQKWDQSTLDNFQNSTECVHSLFALNNASSGEGFSYDFPASEKTRVKSKLADFLGLQLSIKSYNLTKEMFVESDTVYSRDQLFFIGFAQSLCASYSEEDLLHEIDEGSQTPVPFRVDNLLDVIAEFHDAWNCPAGEEYTCLI